MKNIPDYFLALVKQHANLRSDDEARRAIEVISSSLDVVLARKNHEALFALLPQYLRPEQRIFYVKLVDWRPRYKHATLVTRVKLSLNLTDDAEAKTLLIAYFRAVKLLVGHDKRLRIARILPHELSSLYIKA